jgi:hypothetical protein
MKGDFQMPLFQEFPLTGRLTMINFAHVMRMESNNAAPNFTTLTFVDGSTIEIPEKIEMLKERAGRG